MDALLSELIKRAANENAAMVDPRPAPAAPASPAGAGKSAQLAFLAGLGADISTTAFGTATGKVSEVNPLAKWAGNKAAAPIVAGTGIGQLLLSRMLAKSHPKIAKAILYGTGAAHGIAAASNIHQMNKPDLIQGPDGRLYDPKTLTVLE